MENGVPGKLSLRQGQSQLSGQLPAGHHSNPRGIDRVHGQVGAQAGDIKLRPDAVIALQLWHRGQVEPGQVLPVEEGNLRHRFFLRHQSQRKGGELWRNIGQLAQRVKGDGLGPPRVADAVHPGGAGVYKEIAGQRPIRLYAAGNGSQILRAFLDCDDGTAVPQTAGPAGNAADVILSGQGALDMAAADGGVRIAGHTPT